MPLFNSSIIKLENENYHKTVLEYQPQKVIREISQTIKDYISDSNDKNQKKKEKKEKKEDFKISEPIRIQCGIAEIEQKTIEEKVEQIVLEKMKEVEEQAYEKAFLLGKEDGKKEAFEVHQKQIEMGLEKLQSLIKNILEMKKEILKSNESFFIKLLGYFSEKISLDSIKFDQNKILKVIEKIIVDIQPEEEITLQVSPDDYEFIKKVQENNQIKFNFFKNISLEKKSFITSGGCFLKTNFVAIDATLKERVNKFHQMIEEAVPKLNSKKNIVHE